jgi:hypothetical protein
MYYIGLDVHKRKISYRVKDGSGAINSEGNLQVPRGPVGSSASMSTFTQRILPLDNFTCTFRWH